MHNRERIEATARAAGLSVDTSMSPHATDARPLPVRAFSAIAAWLVSLPLISAIGALFIGVSGTAGSYLFGLLCCAGAVVLMNRPQMSIFIEQMGLPLLLAGLGGLGISLTRDLQANAADLILCLGLLGIAVMLPSQWYRSVCGFGAGLALMAAVTPHMNMAMPTLVPVYVGVLIAAVGLLAQSALLRDGPHWCALLILENLSAGWVISVLAADMVLGTMRSHMAAAGSDLPFRLLSVVSVLGAYWIAARTWPSLRAVALGLAVLALSALAWFLPALGVCLLVMSGSARLGRWRTAGLALVAAVEIVGTWYYLLDLSLSQKAAALVACGLAIALCAWTLDRVRAKPVQLPQLHAPAWLLLATALPLLVLNFSIQQKEDIIAHGAPLLAPLQPVDPRSIMQGDYMALRIADWPDDDIQRLQLDGSQRPFAIGKRDARGIVSHWRLAQGPTVEADEVRVELTRKNGHWIIVSDAWYFPEGEATHWAAARYGEFRVDADGHALLVGLRDDRLNPL